MVRANKKNYTLIIFDSYIAVASFVLVMEHLIFDIVKSLHCITIVILASFAWARYDVAVDVQRRMSWS